MVLSPLAVDSGFSLVAISALGDRPQSLLAAQQLASPQGRGSAAPAAGDLVGGDPGLLLRGRHQITRLYPAGPTSSNNVGGLAIQRSWSDRPGLAPEALGRRGRGNYDPCGSRSGPSPRSAGQRSRLSATCRCPGPIWPALGHGGNPGPHSPWLHHAAGPGQAKAAVDSKSGWFPHPAGGGDRPAGRST